MRDLKSVVNDLLIDEEAGGVHHTFGVNA